MQCECPERAPIPCDTSDLHAPCCAAQQLACVPGPKPRRETRDANAEEATGEKQLLRLERPFQTAGPTYNVIQNARGFLTKQVMRCRARLTAPLGRAQPPLSTTPYFGEGSCEVLGGHGRAGSGGLPPPRPPVFLFFFSMAARSFSTLLGASLSSRCIFTRAAGPTAPYTTAQPPATIYMNSAMEPT